MWSGSSSSTLKTTPSCSPGGYLARRQMICSCFHHRRRSARCGRHTIMPFHRVQGKQSATPSSAPWRQLTPQVLVMCPMSDLCWVCQQNSTLIMLAHNRPEEKSEVLLLIISPYRHYTEERSICFLSPKRDHSTDPNWRSARSRYMTTFSRGGVFVPPQPHGMVAPASNAILAQYSFDFAQQVHYPSNPLQPGPIYFLTPRKAAIFRVCCEAIPR